MFTKLCWVIQNGNCSQREELPNLFPHTSSHSCSKLQVGVFYRHALWISRCASRPPRKTLFFVWEHNTQTLPLLIRASTEMLLLELLLSINTAPSVSVNKWVIKVFRIHLSKVFHYTDNPIFVSVFILYYFHIDRGSPNLYLESKISSRLEYFDLSHQPTNQLSCSSNRAWR